MYYSNNLSTTSPVQLNTPSPSLFGLPLLPLANTTGLLFGFSVDGAGDYNNDGYADVVVGAPAGVDLSSLGGIFSGQVLGGSAYVYYGNGTGINNAIGVRLQANPAGLLSNVANLFGYKIKGVRNAFGSRNGNILVGVPAGNVLSNVLNGLQVKAGQVHVFVKKASSPASPVISDQALSSPRGTSVLSILAGQDMNVSLLHGASMDNIRDVNCDGHADIIVGEPLSTAVPLIGTDLIGGAAYIYTGQPNGTYTATPFWDLTTVVSPSLGVNATALLGYSVTGAGYVNGFAGGPKALVGGPSNALDFGTGVLNTNNTLATTFDFIADDNGLGKSYMFSFRSCNVFLPVRLLQFNRQVKGKSVLLDWSTANEEKFSRFEIQRSGNGSEFETIAVVLGKGKQKNEYQHTDDYPFRGLNFYRLRLVDQSGGFTYSQTLIARIDDEMPAYVVIAPNPVRNNVLKVKLAGFKPGIYQLQLSNGSGQVLLTRTVITNGYDHLETIIPRLKMASGIYALKVLDKDNVPVKILKILVDG